MRRQGALLGGLVVALLGGAACANGNTSDGAGAAPQGASSGDGGEGQQGAGGVGAQGGSGGAGGQGGSGGSDVCDPTSTPADSLCVVTEELGIFVRAEGKDTAAGTRDEPVRTMQKAIDLAQAQAKRVYACASNTFPEVVAVPAGVEIYGGLDCAHDWAWQAAKPTVITSPSDTVPVRLLGGTGTTRLVDMRIEAVDASAPGGSSIAIIADSTTVELERCTVLAGDGAAGSKGEAYITAADAGAAGTEGKNDSCTGGTNGVIVGGPAAINPACTESGGGKGGNSATSSSELGQSGEDGLPAGIGGKGGKGQTGAFSYTDPDADLTLACAFGTSGDPGIDGNAGVGGVGDGVLSTAGFSGMSGADGTAGTPGQGGGGGGGGIGCESGGSYDGNNSGGSGGVGGCGGLGARGGQAGGSSIALVSLNSQVWLIDTVVSASAGGNGGEGGDPQEGGLGGIGGAGKSDGVLVPTNSCGGGTGGTGGRGGFAGGGTAGHSAAVAHIGAPPSQIGSVTLQYKSGGTGGLGSGGSQSTKGTDGKSTKMLAFVE